MKKFFLLLMACCLFGLAWSQTKQIKGKVTDDKGTPIGGVSVIPKDGQSGVGVRTDSAGNFTVNVSADKVELTFTHVGYTNQSIIANTGAINTIQLTSQNSNLDDVVVIGYGTVKRKDLTGTVSSVSGAQIEKVPVANVAEALTGRMPGVQVTTIDGQPGADIVIRVRGGGSITGSNDPLYIVDGFRVNSINDIATTDIANVDVLKDAATTAIYGAAGANGVVIITTKSAKGGKTTISYNGYEQIKTLPKKLEVLSPYEFVLAQYEYARIRSQTEVDAFSKYFGVYDDLELYKYQKGTDWQKQLFGNPAYSQQHSIGVTGGSDKTKVSLNFTNNNDLGLIPSNNYQRNYLNLKINHDLSKVLKLDFGIRYTQAVTNGAGTSGTSNLRIGDGVTTRPVNGLADVIAFDGGVSDDDYENFIKSRVNPLELAAQDYRKRATQVLNFNAGLSWAVTKNITYRTEGSYGRSYGNLRRYYGPLTSVSRNEGGNLPLGEITQSQLLDYRWANTVNFQFRRGEKHDLSFLVGQEILGRNQGFEEYNRAKGFDLSITPEKLFANMVKGTTDIHTTTDIAANKIASFFGRVIYQFDRKYIFNATARYDGSTVFAPGKQWGFFPAASFAWRISQENFMENVRFVNDLKFRASYGTVGNNNIGTDLWRVLFTSSITRPYGAGDILNPYNTYASGLLPNPNIKWETTITRNVGLDFSLFRSRINGTLDFYHNTTKDLLVESTIPTNTGFTRQQRNIGQTSNRGIELSFNTDLVSNKDFQLSLNFNVGMNRARIDKLDGVDERYLQSNWAGTDLRTQDDYKLAVGSTIGLMYGYVTDGMYTVDDFLSYNPANRTYALKPGIPTVALGGIGLYPGTLKLKDLNGDGVVNAVGDRQVIGSALPKATGGFGFNTTYKGFDLSAFFNWVYGNDVYNTGKISFNMLYRTNYGNMLNTSNYENRFHYIDARGNLLTSLKDLAAENPNPQTWSPFSMGTASPWFHSYAVEDGSFLRLNTLSLGYSLPKKWVSKIFMSRLRIYGTVYNAFVLTNYSGYDPEVSTTRSSGYSQLTPGVDYSAYPKNRSFTFGANVTF